jgi:hypothetical protein
VGAQERQALVDLFHATGGPRWKDRAGWLGPAGTECDWHGVQCDPGPVAPTNVVGLDLADNNLTGTVPSSLGALSRVEYLFLFGNHLTGRLPDSVLQGWVTGAMHLAADAPQLTAVSEVEFESSSPELLCAFHRIVLRADGLAQMVTERCRNATPEDRSTWCELKLGRIGINEFARLGWTMEKQGFLGLKANYERNVTHGPFETITATIAGRRSRVVNYADAGPLELWQLHRAIEGVAGAADWEQTSTEPSCPRGLNSPR